MKTRKIFGILFTIIGAVLILLSGWAFLAGGVTIGVLPVSKWGSLVPFFIGAIFFSSGMKLVRSTRSVKYGATENPEEHKPQKRTTEENTA